MEMRHPLLPETIERISKAQASRPRTFESDLHASCMAYRSAEDWANYFSKKGKRGEAEAVAYVSMRDRQYVHLKKLLALMVEPVTDEYWEAWITGRID